jgi:PTS system beta-glucosides-specific IIC component
VKQGDRVKSGDEILEFDMDAITKEGYSLITPIIVTNSDEYFDLIETTDETVDYLNLLIRVIPNKGETVSQLAEA